MRVLSAVWLLCALAVSAGTLPIASAQQGDPSREREAKAEFEAGVAAAQAQDYARAREHFLRSRQLVVKASTLLNLALADLKLGLVDEALFALDAIEAPAEGPEQGRLRKRAREMRGQVEALREAIAAERAEQARAADAPSAAPPERPDLSVKESAEPAGVEESPRVVSEPPAAAPTPSAPHERPSLVGPRVLLAVGGALGAGAIGGALWWRHRNRVYDECLHGRENMRCQEEAEIARERRAAMAVTLVLGGAAVGLIATGAIWLVGRKDERRSSINVALLADRDRLGAIASGSF